MFSLPTQETPSLKYILLARCDVTMIFFTDKYVFERDFGAMGKRATSGRHGQKSQTSPIGKSSEEVWSEPIESVGATPEDSVIIIKA